MNVTAIATTVVRAQCGHEVRVSGRPDRRRVLARCPDCHIPPAIRRWRLEQDLLADQSRNPDLVEACH